MYVLENKKESQSLVTLFKTKNLFSNDLQNNFVYHIWFVYVILCIFCVSNTMQI